MWPGRRITLIAVLFVALLSWAPRTLALTYVSNLDEPYVVNFSAMPPPHYCIGSSFTTDGAGYVLNSLTVSLDPTWSAGGVLEC